MRAGKNSPPNVANSRASRVAKRSFKLQEFERAGISID